jgi:homotetrameric cytidine deaminase
MDWDQLLSHAYAPYSGNPECCLVRGKSGVYYPGVLVENVSYPLSMTAEQIAFCSCLAAGEVPEALIYRGQPASQPLFWQEEFDLEYTVYGNFPGGNLFNPLIQLHTTAKERLKQLNDYAVTPNSSFPVSAIAEVENGVIEGVNIEFSAWNLGLCAERVALGRAITAGFREFGSLSIFAPKSDFASPCGGCRQVICEWMSGQVVGLYHGNGTFSSLPARDFLPYSMKTSSLKKQIKPPSA